MVQRSWVNFQCRGVLLIWIIVAQGPIALAVGAGGVFGQFFSRLSFLLFSPSLGDAPIYTEILSCFKGPLNPNNQPTSNSPVAKKILIRP